MRVGGKATEGTFVTAGPVVVAEQLPDSHPSKALGVKFNAAYEQINGAGSRNQFAAHSYDATLDPRKGRADRAEERPSPARPNSAPR